MNGRAVRFRLQARRRRMGPNSNHCLLPLIRKLESIATLSDGEREAVESLPVRVQVLRPHQDIVRDGDRASQCCVVLDGWLCRYKIISEGKRQIFSFHIAGDIPDLQSLHIPLMDHSLATITAATVAFIPHEAVHDCQGDKYLCNDGSVSSSKTKCSRS